MNEKLLEQLKATQNFLNNLIGLKTEITCELVSPTVFRYTFGSDTRYISAENIDTYLQLQLDKVNNWMRMVRTTDEDEQIKLSLIHNEITIKAIAYHISHKDN